MKFSKLVFSFLSSTVVVLNPTLVSANDPLDIVGGSPADDGEYPSFVVSNGGGCGGVLVAEDIVLTAGHCNDDPGPAFPVDGSLCIGANMIDCSDAAETWNVAEFIRHPDYGDTQGGGSRNDVMLVRINGKSSQPLWKWNKQSLKPKKEETVTAIGFGLTSDGGTSSDVLLEVDLDIVKFDDCEEVYGDDLEDDIMICAGATDKGVCNGDSGGPLFRKDNKETIVGLTSFGIGCDANPAVFTRVSAFDEWIRDNICDISEHKPKYCDLPNNGALACFSHANTVEVEGKGLIPMDALKIGDSVRSGQGHYSRVYSFLHLDHNVEADFLQIHAQGLKNPLELSPEHMIFVENSMFPVLASQVKVGDMLGENMVSEVKSVKRNGVYAPVTEAGDIVVSGVVASSYAGVRPSSLINQHLEAHAFFSFRRLVCAVDFGVCENETYTEEGSPSWLSTLIGFAKNTQYDASVHLLASIVGLPLIAVAYGFERVLFSPFLATIMMCVSGFFLYKKTMTTSKVHDF